MKMIDAEALEKAMYHEAFEKDSDMQKWDSGCWIRYKMFENVIADAQTVDTIVIPKSATNGDMIKALFPNIKWWINTDRQIFAESGTLNLDWWNTPYKIPKGDKK